MQARATSPCLTEDVILALGRGKSLADAPDAEAHLADCATCSALLATAVGDAAPWNALAGTQLGPYNLDAQIGTGGMGAVYRAIDTRLDRAIAIKVLHGESTRLAAEARAAAAIDHPAIVAIHDVGSANGTAYVAMELVDGESLRSVIDRGASPERAREIAIELADALTAAHARGVIHRDLKPENLIVARDGRLRILDFGLAKLVDADPLDATIPGTVQGTAGYMAPEQARGEAADARADIFALGAIVYEVATGKRAFGGATHADRLSAVLRDDPPVDDLGALGPLVDRCLAKDPAARFQSAADLAWMLRRAFREDAPLARAGRDRDGRDVARAGRDRGGRDVARAGAARSPFTRRSLLVGAGAAALAGIGGFLLGRRRAGYVASPPPAFRLLTYKTGRVYTARFTPDGNRVVFGAAWDADPVRGFVADLATGTTDALAVDGDILAISPRGELALCVNRKFTQHQSATGTLAVRPLGGGVPRILAEDVQDADYGAQLAVIRRTKTGFAIEMPVGTRLVESHAWITHVRVSPDGKTIAYAEHPNVNDDAGDLRVLDVASRQVRVLAAGWDSIAGIAWDPDGTAIWFTANRGGPQNVVHSIRLDGTLARIAETTGRLRLHDLAADRRAIVSVDAWRLRAMIGGVDRSLTEISLVTDLNREMALVGEVGNADASGAYLIPVGGGAPLRLGDGFPLAMSPSGQRVVANVGDKLVVYSTASGDRPAIAAPGWVTSARWIDETSVVATAKKQTWILGGTPILLSNAGGRLAIDPARRRCAFVDAAGALHVVDLAARTETVIGTFERRFACGWLAEPDAIVLCTLTSPLELVRVDPTTGATTPHMVITPPALGLKAVDSVVLHPDGVHHAYSYGQELSQLYVMSTPRDR